MIKSVTVINNLGESLKLELRNPEKSGFFIKSIDGLGPVKATINTTEMSTTDGSLYNSSRIGERNIVLDLGFMWKNTVEEVRHLSYKYFPVKRLVTLLIETDDRSCAIDGYVESNEPNIFSKESGCQVSILCPNPYFYDATGEQVTVFSGVTPYLQFPLSTTSSITFSTLDNMSGQTVYYTGDADVGMMIELHSIGNVTDPSIINVNTNEKIEIDTAKLQSATGSGIIAGDTIYIITVKGHKSAELVRNSQHYNILNCLKANYSWMQLSPGDNIFAYTADTGDLNLQLKITNDVLYEGV